MICQAKQTDNTIETNDQLRRLKATCDHKRITLIGNDETSGEWRAICMKCGCSMGRCIEQGEYVFNPLPESFDSFN